MFGRQWLIDKLTRKLVKPVPEEMVLQSADTGFLLNKRKLPPEEVATLREEARAFKESLLWQLLKSEVEYAAFRHMTDTARTAEDLVWSKSIYYATNLQQKFLDRLSL